MGRDKYPRAYLFEIEVNGLTLVECDRITGMQGERSNFEHKTAEGRGVPLAGGFGISTLEIHGANPSNLDFFEWYNSQDPERKSGTVLIKDQSLAISKTVLFSDMIPKGINLDDPDRKTEDKHGTTYRVDCVLQHVS